MKKKGGSKIQARKKRRQGQCGIVGAKENAECEMTRVTHQPPPDATTQQNHGPQSTTTPTPSDHRRKPNPLQANHYDKASTIIYRPPNHSLHMNVN